MTPYIVLIVVGLALLWWAAGKLGVLPESVTGPKDGTGMGV